MVYRVRCFRNNEMSLLFLRGDEDRRKANKEIHKLFGQSVRSIRVSKDMKNDMSKFNIVFA